MGLTSEQVKLRIEQGLVNKIKKTKTKSIKQIILGNVFTIFNILNIFLAVIVLLVGSYKNILFLGIVICNTLISIIQEIRSKLIIDKLSVITTNKVNVIRDDKELLIPFDEIVIDDLIVLRPGNQILTDCIITEGSITVNESILTGESDLINYKVNNEIKSGSFVTSGYCKAKVIHVGKDNYAYALSDVKNIKPINSILMKSLNKIIKFLSIVIVPLGIVLFLNQYGLNHDFNNSVIRTVAAIIGMIPEGLVLLTSSVLAVSIIRLYKLNVLVQELYCIEMLARVDTICLDKTGTITDGKMSVIKVIPLGNYNVDEIMGNIINNLNESNATFQALKDRFKVYDNYKVIKTIPFSSEAKYSGVEFDFATYKIGAPEFVSKNKIKEVSDNQDNRVLLLTSDKEDIAVIVLKDNLRKNAKEMFEYFKKQNVNIKIISGDNAQTVSNVISKSGLSNFKCIDISNMNDDDLRNNVLKYDVFARVNPIQKKIIVETLQQNNHFVAMTGDGVNDVLALKQADCSITIKDSTEAAKSVSQIVLLDNDFKVIPNIVDEGRRTINNIERSASLFLAKTSYALLLAVIFVFVNMNYPFEPIQFTLTSCFTIGIPSFILALEPNRDKIKGNFLINVLSNALPCAFTIVINIIILTILGYIFNMPHDQVSTLCVVMSAFTGFLLLFKISYPFNKIRLLLIIMMISGFIFSVVGLRNFFSLTIFNLNMFLFVLVLVFLSIIIFEGFSICFDKFSKKHSKLFE